MNYKNKIWSKIWRNLIIWMAIIFAVFPIVFIIGTSFNPANSINTTQIFPRNPTLENYKSLIIGENNIFLVWVWNTLKISFLTAGISVFLCSLAAYAFSRFRFKGRRMGLLTILLVQMFPQTLGITAIFLIMTWFNDKIPFIGLNTHSGLILVYLGGAIGMNTWLMKGYFDSIPKSLEEAAYVDGATSFKAFRAIILPLARPILVVIFIIQFIGTYSEYMIASTLLKGDKMYTLAVGLRLFVGQHYDDRWGPFAAAGVLGSIIVIVIFYSLQDLIVSGLTGGAIKE
jgi:maltose/maltodextrin transport system permease protein/arabinogalactan oligomer/maltooligosaccharide transport system permease protein